MVTIDHIRNISRIVQCIKADKEIYDSGKTQNTLRSVIFGNPENNDKLAIKTKPALYVTTKDSMQNTNYSFGQLTQNNQHQATFEYELVLIAVSKYKSESSQKQIYELLTKLRKTITNNPRFFNKDEEDPIFSRSIINNVTWDSKTRGQLITSITLTLLATIGTAFSVTFPDIGNVILLSKPNNPEGIIFSENRTQEKINRVLTENGNFGSLSVEYESTNELDEQFRNKLGVEENIILHTGTANRTISVKYIDINATAQFDQIERTVLHMEIV